jgi:hypothetical protein
LVAFVNQQQNLNMQMNSLLNYPNQMNMFNMNQFGGMLPQMQQMQGSQMQPNPLVNGMQGQMQNSMMNGMMLPNMGSMSGSPMSPSTPDSSLHMPQMQGQAPQIQGQIQPNPMVNGMIVPNMNAMSPGSMGSNANGTMFPFIMDPNSMPGFNPNINNGAFMQNMNQSQMPNLMKNQIAQSPSADSPATPQNMSPNNAGVPMFLPQQPPNTMSYNPLAQPMQQPTTNAVNGNPAYSPQLSNQQQQLPMMSNVYAGSPVGMNNQGGFPPMQVFPQVSGFQSSVPTPSSMFINQPAINRRSVPVPPGL